MPRDTPDLNTAASPLPPPAVALPRMARRMYEDNAMHRLHGIAWDDAPETIRTFWLAKARHAYDGLVEGALS